jgi:hypothetical protein
MAYHVGMGALSFMVVRARLCNADLLLNFDCLRQYVVHKFWTWTRWWTSWGVHGENRLDWRKGWWGFFVDKILGIRDRIWWSFSQAPHSYQFLISSSNFEQYIPTTHLSLSITTMYLDLSLDLHYKHPCQYTESSPVTRH